MGQFGNKVNFILRLFMKMIVTADWHLKATMPRCRKDENWIDTQRKILSQVVSISKNKKAPVFVVGDIFDSNSDTSFECISMVQELADELGTLHILAGNHDLPYHSSENIRKSAIGILLNSNKVHLIKDFFEDLDVSASNFDEEDDHDAQIVFKHTLTLPEKNPLFESETPETLKRKFPNAKWIFTGDYHKDFCVSVGKNEEDKCYVINPGCLIREKSDFKDYQCGVYYVDTEEEIIEFIPIIDDEELVDDSYITVQNEREERIDNFVNKIKDTKTISLDFIENVNRQLLENKFSNEFVDTVSELITV